MMILLCRLAIKSEFRMSFSPTLDNEITTKLLLFSIFSFLAEKLNISCSDIFKWTSVLHRAMGRVPVTLSLCYTMQISLQLVLQRWKKEIHCKSAGDMLNLVSIYSQQSLNMFLTMLQRGF